MPMAGETWTRRLQDLVARTDGVLLPVCAGCLTFLLAVQAAGRLPFLREHLDAAADRFVQMPSEVVPASVATEHATITLYLSPETSLDAPIQVFCNGRLVGVFERASWSLQLHEGDQITLYAPTLDHSLTVKVDQNNPRLLTPAPGWTATLGPDQPRVHLPIAKFTV